MLIGRRPWREELDIIDRTMRAISSVTDPEDVVTAYWENIGELMPINDYVSVSRRGETPPNYLITRSSRFVEEFNPWTQRDRLPRMSGGLFGEIVYGNKPEIIEDLPAVLSKDDPAHFYLEGFTKMVALTQYDGGESLNVTGLLFKPGQEFDPAMIPLLHWQSGLFGRGTQNLVLKNQLGEALAKLDRELQVVGNIQRSLLPDVLPAIGGFELAADYHTSARAGGDYYDFFPLDDGSWGLFIADVSGHGTPAAVLMAITHALAHAHPGSHFPPAKMLANLNRRLIHSYTKGGTFVTAFYGTIDPAKRMLIYSIAGHNPPRLVRDGRVISLDGNGAVPLGILDDESYGESTITMQKDDLLLLYTDGITEAMAPIAEGQRELFGVERLDRVLLTCGETSPEACIAQIRRAVADFSHHAPPADDQTLIAIRCVS